MEETLTRIFGRGGEIGLCVKDSERKVSFQNDLSIELCGEQLSNICKKGCMDLYVSNELCPARGLGAQLFTNKRIKDQFVDIVVLNNGREIVTLLYPVAVKHERELAFFKDKGLSKREFEIVERVVRGATNSEIIKELAITKATLKTHLNNIYKKLPPESRIGFRRRAMQ